MLGVQEAKFIRLLKKASRGRWKRAKVAWVNQVLDDIGVYGSEHPTRGVTFSYLPRTEVGVLRHKAAVESRRLS